MPDKSLSLVAAQINPIVGDITGNSDKITKVVQKYEEADLVAFPEMVLSGYPAEDLVLKPTFIDHVMAEAENLAKQFKDGPVVLLGAPWRVDGKIYNAALFLDGGKIAHVHLKCHLPNYGVFDEVRIFDAGTVADVAPYAVNGVKVGALVCEDMWFADTVARHKEKGAEILISLNGSPYEFDKDQMRLKQAEARIKESGLPIVYLNMVGGQDELVFDGGSFWMNAHRAAVHFAPFYRDYTATMTWKKNGSEWTADMQGDIFSAPEKRESVYNAIILGLRDYIDKNGFKGVVFGLSGGIDSALCAVMATDALGKDRVHPYMLPSPYTSQESRNDAEQLCKALGLKLETIEIEPAMKAFDEMLAGTFNGAQKDITEENVQSRIRMLTLMAISNKTGNMLLATGNKSELSVGYATIYGDMSGGFALIKDLYKMTVFELCRWRNRNIPSLSKVQIRDVIPDSILIKPPSAELKHNQKDEDNLPPYPVLDDMLYCLIEEEMSLADTIARGHDAEIAIKIWNMLDAAEYKRRQAPPGVKISRKAFGKERRYPITNRFRFQVSDFKG